MRASASVIEAVAADALDALRAVEKVHNGAAHGRARVRASRSLHG
jgi:hypothetical protein